MGNGNINHKVAQSYSMQSMIFDDIKPSQPLHNRLHGLFPGVVIQDAGGKKKQAHKKRRNHKARKTVVNRINREEKKNSGSLWLEAQEEKKEKQRENTPERKPSPRHTFCSWDAVACICSSSKSK